MDNRPININLLKIKLPISAFLSISHRVSGILIFFFVLPSLAVILNLAKKDSLILDDYFISSLIYMLFIIFSYHVFAGIRHLLMDFNLIKETLQISNLSSIITLVFFIINAIFGAIIIL